MEFSSINGLFQLLFTTAKVFRCMWDWNFYEKSKIYSIVQLPEKSFISYSRKNFYIDWNEIRKPCSNHMIEHFDGKINWKTSVNTGHCTYTFLKVILVFWFRNIFKRRFSSSIHELMVRFGIHHLMYKGKFFSVYSSANKNQTPQEAQFQRETHHIPPPNFAPKPPPKQSSF